MEAPVLTVVTCAHNPRPALFTRTLASLRQQTLPVGQWEYLLVDNLSEPSLDSHVDLVWHPQARVVVERDLGLTPARLRGIREAQADLILFVDDDMVLQPDYLERAVQLFQQHPFVGALGGCGTGEYLAPREPWVDEFKFILLDHSGSPDRQVDFQYAMAPVGGPWVPVGAGMAVRRAVARAYAAKVENDPERRYLDRRGGSLCGSGDADLSFTAIDLGLACATSARLQFTHLIEAHRLTLPYLRRLLYSSNYFTARLLRIRGWKAALKTEPPTILDRWRRALMGLRPASPSRICWGAFAKGYRDGLGDAPFDERFL